VTFSTAVTGVDTSDFQVSTGGSAVANGPVQVSMVNSSIYSITVSAVSGEGTVELSLVDDGSIRDLAGNRLTGTAGGLFAPTQTLAAGPAPYALASGDMNNDGRSDLLVTNGISGGTYEFLEFRAGCLTALYPLVESLTKPMRWT